VVRIGASGSPEAFRVTKLLGARGLGRVELDEVSAGELAVIAGVESIQIGDTVCAPGHPDPLPRIAIDPPTIRVRFSVNNSPFAGRDGRCLTSRQIGERLVREALGNVSVRVEASDSPDTFVVAGRGELQVAVLIETMRREGYEFSVSRPEIIRREVDGVSCEPVEDVVAEVPDGCTGLFGYRSEFLSDTRGEGVLHRTVRGYEPWAGELTGRGVGAVVATETGKTTAYSLFNAQERVTLFVGAGAPVYEGQVIGENRRAGDMNVNASRAKKLTNVRAAGRDEATVLSPHRQVAIEWALEWMADDELLEVTPLALRLRKRVLPANLRKR
jgi:GTP-binding protein